MEIKYVKGDATSPMGTGNKIIVHVCNDVGGWGKGFVMALSAKWNKPEKKYREWYQLKENFELGQSQFVKVEEDIWVANMIGQRDIKKDKEGNPPVRYDAIASTLNQVCQFAMENNASVHMPRIGCGLAGGDWKKMELIILEELTDKKISVVVYDF